MLKYYGIINTFLPLYWASNFFMTMPVLIEKSDCIILELGYDFGHQKQLGT